MKQLCLSLLGVVLLTLPCKSQTLSDGKVWNFVEKMYEHDDIERAYTVTVCGDTVVNGQLCKKLVKTYQDTPAFKRTFVVFEKNSKIYGIWGDETKLLLNFNMHVGDKVDEHWAVDSVDNIDINNKNRKRIILACNEYDFKRYIVEGIGLSSTKFYTNELTSYYDVLESVYENGICIFSNSDFYKQTTGISNKQKTEENCHTILYDYLGKRVLTPQKGHIYIKGNKKIIL